VKSRFARSVLLLGARRPSAFVVDKSFGAGPLNLVVANPQAFVAGESLAISAVRAPPFRPALPGTDRAKLRRVLAQALPRHAPPDSLVSLFAPPERSRPEANRDALFRKAFAQIAAGRLAAGVRSYRARRGLTPAGDVPLRWMLALACADAAPSRGKSAPMPLEKTRSPTPSWNCRAAASTSRCKTLQAPSSARVKAVARSAHSGADLLLGCCGAGNGSR
jgi:hypothetical protein